MALTFTDDEQAQLFELLGLPADTDPTDTAAILAVVADLAAQSTGEQKASDVAAAAKRHGLEALDTETAAALRADAAEGRRLVAAAARAATEQKVDAAISRGKITPARRDHWLELLTADPAMADVLASTSDGTAVPLSEVGHTAGGDVTESATWFH